MEILINFIDIFVHLDHHMNLIIEKYGTGTYLIVFLIIFCETGLVVTPFLPGDSLLFVLGALAAGGPLKIDFLIILLASAAILGNTVNYWIGCLFAPRIFRNENIRFLKKEYLERTHRFFEKYGGKTIIITRFLPIIRTFAPFLAGVGSMTYWKFLIYNILGGVLWVTSFVLGGYYFGNMPAVKKNFSFVVLAIIVISVIPAVIEFVKARRQHRSPLNAK